MSHILHKGATEVIGVFSGFDYNTPVYSSEIQCLALGVDIKIFDDAGLENVHYISKNIDHCN